MADDPNSPANIPQDEPAAAAHTPAVDAVEPTAPDVAAAVAEATATVDTIAAAVAEANATAETGGMITQAELDQVLSEAGFSTENSDTAVHADAFTAPIVDPPGMAAATYMPPPIAAAAQADDHSAEAAAIDLINDVSLDVKVELGRAKMMVEDVLRLGSGSVVELDKLAGDPVDIFVNERLVARGEVLVLNDDFCVRISEIITPTAELAEG